MKGVDRLREVPTRRCRSLLVGLLLLATACAGDDDDGPTATVPTEVPTSSTTAVADVSTIPPVIDEAYLNRVLEALDAADGMATRIIVERKDLVPEAAQILNAIYSDEEFKDQVDVWLTDLGNDPQLASIKSNPGDRRTTVQRIIHSSPSCVWMAVRRDYSATATRPPAPRTEYIALRPLDRSNDPRRLNPTAWMIAVAGFNEDGSEPGNQCAES